MTNNPTIDGVSRELRELLERVVGKPTGKPNWDALDEGRIAAAEELRALLDTPAVERQEPAEWCDPLQLKAVIQGVVARERMRPKSLTDREVAESVYSAITEHLPVYEDVYDQLSEMIEPHVKRPYRIDAPLPASVVDSMRFLLKAHISAPELAALQSTIAQFEDKLKKAIDLDFQRRETIARLENGRGESVGWQFFDNGEWHTGLKVNDHRKNTEEAGYLVRDVYAAPPAPVAVVLPERADALTGSHDAQQGWNDCLDATAALNGERK